MNGAEVTTLPSGLRVATRSMPHARSLSVGLWVLAGARDECDNETGIAHMLEHMAFKGTKSRSARDIATEVENAGGYMNAHTSREETAYYLRLLPEYLDMGIDILSDILTNPTMPDDEIERERGVIIQEIGQSQGRFNNRRSGLGFFPKQRLRLRVLYNFSKAQVSASKDPKSVPRDAVGPQTVGPRAHRQTQNRRRETL